MSDNELFENIEIVEKKKPKRKLTEAQLSNLKRGREKMAEKRRLLKEQKELIKHVTKQDKKAVKENKVIKKEQKTERKRKTKDQDKELEHLTLLRKKKEEKLKQEQEESIRIEQAEKLSKFSDLRSKWVRETKTEEEYIELTEALDEIEEETIIDDNKLETTLLSLMERYKT